MNPTGLDAYVPLLVHLLVAALLAGVLILLSTLIGWRRPSKVKQQTYECGMTPTGDARQPFSVKFYLVAMVFILFDVEAIFLYPWALIFKENVRDPATRWYIFLLMMFYLDVLVTGYVYLLKKGALDWNSKEK
jgi:NADH-quinone oxidoreductase subunit A